MATPDLSRTHRFYTEAMGFELVKVVVGATPEGGWAKHVFYDIGDGDMIAFWELHGSYPAVDGGMSRGVGLPDWVNHLAFRAVDGEHLEVAKKRWLGLGIDVLELDHGFCRSIYTNDVNGTLVEWCTDTPGLTDDDRRRAAELLSDPSPEMEPGPQGEFHEADHSLQPAWLTV